MSPARNVEIKARIASPARQHALAAALADAEAEVIDQVDVFFHTPRGRLKLRITSPSRGELIYYERADESGPKTSAYTVAPTHSPELLHAALAGAYGVRSTVAKRRHLYRVGRTRIHIDEVRSLGDFLELEVVLADGEAVAGGEREARALMRELEVAESDLVAGAYVDLLDPR